MNVAFSITSIGFVLPSAACDFKMTTMDKGRLSAAPMLGNTLINAILSTLARLYVHTRAMADEWSDIGFASRLHQPDTVNYII